MVNQRRTTPKYHQKCLTPVINNGGLSSNAVYGYDDKKEYEKKIGRYIRRTGNNRLSWWTNEVIGMTHAQHWSKYSCVRSIQRKEGKKTLYQILKGQ